MIFGLDEYEMLAVVIGVIYVAVVGTFSIMALHAAWKGRHERRTDHGENH